MQPFNIGGLNGLPDIQQMQVNVPPPQPRSGGMFASGGVGRGIAGTIGDFLLQRAGAQPIYAPAMQQRQQQAAEQAQYQQRLQDARETWMQQQQWGQDHPKTPEPTEFERAVQAAGLQPGTPEYTSLMRQFVTNRANPMQALDVTQPDGSVVRQFIRPSGGIPQAPVGKLTPIGGPTLPASGNFPR